MGGISLYMNADQPEVDGAEALLGECDWLRRLARSLVSDDGRAEDAVQETLAAAIQGSSRGEAPNRSWLSRVLRNALAQESRGRLRREDRESLVEPRSASPASDKIAERMELQRKVFESVNALEPIYRDVIVLRFFDALPPREIAKRLGSPVKTIHTRLERGLEQLRGKLDAEFGGDRSAWFSALLPFATGTDWVGPVAAPTGSALSPMVKVAVVATVLGIGAAWFYEPAESSPAEVAPFEQEEAVEEPEVVPAELQEPTQLREAAGDPPRIPIAVRENDETPVLLSSIRGRIVDESGVGVSTDLWLLRVTEKERASENQLLLLDVSIEERVVRKTVSDDTGTFEMHDVDRGRWWVGAAPNSEFVSVASLVLLNGELVDMRLEATKGERISGTVTSEGAIRLVGILEFHEECVVVLNRSDMCGTVEAACDGNGFFESLPLPEGSYLGFVRLKRGGGLVRAPLAVVRAGQENYLELPPVGPSITGVVRDAGTGKPTKAKVVLVSTSGSQSHGTGREGPGRFRFQDVGPKVYTLLAVHSDGRAGVLANVDVQNGESVRDLVLYLEPGAPFELKLEGSRDRCRVAITWNGILVHDFTMRKEAPSLLSLPAGPILLTTYVNAQGQRVILSETTATAVAGESTSLVLLADS